MTTRGQTSGKVSVFGIVRRLGHVHRLDGIERKVDRVAAGNGIHHFGVINQQHALAFRRALDVDLSIGGAHNSRHQRQSRQELFLHQGQSIELLRAHMTGGRSTFRGERACRFMNLDALPKLFRFRQDDLQRRRGLRSHFEGILACRQVPHRYAHQVVLTGFQAGKIKFPPLAGGHADSLRWQANPLECAEGGGDGQTFRAHHRAFQILCRGK